MRANRNQTTRLLKWLPLMHMHETSSERKQISYSREIHYLPIRSSIIFAYPHSKTKEKKLSTFKNNDRKVYKPKLCWKLPAAKSNLKQKLKLIWALSYGSEFSYRFGKIDPLRLLARVVWKMTIWENVLCSNEIRCFSQK